MYHVDMHGSGAEYTIGSRFIDACTLVKGPFTVRVKHSLHGVGRGSMYYTVQYVAASKGDA